jgi:hypothetical protein
MSNDESSMLDNAIAEVEAANDKRWRSSLQGVVVFLLPCAKMSECRRRLVLPGILAKGGVVTTDPNAATHCVISIQMHSLTAMNLLSQYKVPCDCILVPDAFLFQ